MWQVNGRKTVVGALHCPLSTYVGSKEVTSNRCSVHLHKAGVADTRKTMSLKVTSDVRQRTLLLLSGWFCGVFVVYPAAVIPAKTSVQQARTSMLCENTHPYVCSDAMHRIRFCRVLVMKGLDIGYHHASLPHHQRSSCVMTKCRSAFYAPNFCCYRLFISVTAMTTMAPPAAAPITSAQRLPTVTLRCLRCCLGCFGGRNMRLTCAASLDQIATAICNGIPPPCLICRLQR